MRGLYVHIPFCVSKCSYCDFYSLPGRIESIEQYVYSVLTEAKGVCHSGGVRSPLIKKDRVYPERSRRPVLSIAEGKESRSGEREVLRHYGNLNNSFQTLYIGGGTPSLLRANNLTTLLDSLRQTLDMSGLVEATIEANPDSTTHEFLVAAKDAGINRISIGVQSLNDAELISVGRVHTAKQAVEAVKRAYSVGFTSVSTDLIVGLPGQTWTSLKDSLETVTELGVNHLSMYCLAVEEGTPLAKSVPANLPSDDTQVELFGKARELLMDKGFSHYEISNFALPGYECQHNLNYWRGGEYLGLGPAAASHLAGKRFRNKPNLNSYLTDPTGQIEYVETLDEEAKIAEEAMLRLRLLEEGLDPREMSVKFSPASVEMLKKRLDRMAQAGLLQFKDSRCTIPASQILVSNRIFREVLGFDNDRAGER